MISPKIVVVEKNRVLSPFKVAWQNLTGTLDSEVKCEEGYGISVLIVCERIQLGSQGASEEDLKKEKPQEI